MSSMAVRYALALEGFRAERNRWVCDVTPGIQSISEIDPNELATDTAHMASAAILEHDRWPLKVTDAGIPTFVVPIRPHWAEQLFDSTLAAGTLFGRDGGLGLSREHVYYRKPRNSNGIRPPARILWYVSGRSAGQHQGSIRAVSQLAEVVVDRPFTVYQRFARLGIYSEDQVRACANDQGMVMALRFVDTELLATPVGLSEIRSLFDSEGAMFVAPMSPRKIDEQWFVQLYKESSIHAS